MVRSSSTLRCITPTCPSPMNCARLPTSAMSRSNSPLVPTGSSGTATPKSMTPPSPGSKGQKETVVEIITLVSVFNWSSPDELERRYQVRNWRRLLQIAGGSPRKSADPGSPRDPIHGRSGRPRSARDVFRVIDPVNSGN